MTIYNCEKDIFEANTIAVENEQIVVKDYDAFRKTTAAKLAATIAITGDAGLKKVCCWIAHETARQFGAIPTSVQGLYDALGRNEAGKFTVPAINIRTLTFDTACVIFRAAKEINAGAFILEIATSEIIYSCQRPLEYSSIVLLAAVKEGYQGPVFIQGDHFQVKASLYAGGPQAGLAAIKDLIAEAIDAGYYNIDIDSSTLVDLNKSSVCEQQKLNCEACAELTKFIRERQPEGITISIGGEIGDIGAHNSTPEEFNAFMQCYLAQLSGVKGISKMSIQTGTSHGGIVLPDGSIAKVKLDFETLQKLSQLARTKYAMAGCVQHGASTLPNEAFHNFPQVGCVEIHLATQFQNIVYDYMPIPLKAKIYEWLHDKCAAMKKPGETNDQFIYHTRKFALGPFKKEITSLAMDVRCRIAQALKEEFDFLFSQLNIGNTRMIVDKFVRPVPMPRDRAHFLKEEKDIGMLDSADQRS